MAVVGAFMFRKHILFLAGSIDIVSHIVTSHAGVTLYHTMRTFDAPEERAF